MRKITIGIVTALLSASVAFSATWGDKNTKTECRITTSDIIRALPFKENSSLKIAKQHKITNSVCSVFLKDGQRFIPVFVLPNGGVIIGSYFKDKENITFNELTNLRKKEMQNVFKKDKKYLKEITIAEYKPKNFNGKWLYAFVDPICPYCRMIEKKLKILADRSGYGIALIPYIVHGKKAFQDDLNFICNKKSFDDYLNEKFGKSNNCEKGRHIIEKSYKIAKDLNIHGTPTFYTSDGIRIDGADLARLKKVLVGNGNKVKSKKEKKERG